MTDHSSNAFARSTRWIIAHRVPVIVAMAATTAFLMSRLGHLRMDSDPKQWTPQTHEYIKTTNLLEQTFGGRNFIVIAVVPKTGDVFQPRVLEKIKIIQSQVEQLPHAVRHNILSFAANKVKQIRGTAEGMEVRPMLEKTPETPQEIAAFRARVDSMPIYVNSLVSADHKAAAIVADFKQDASMPNFIALNAGLRKILESQHDDGIDYLLGGTPIIGEAADHEFMKMPLFFGAAFLVIMIIQFWSFRSIQGMLLPMMTGILSVIWSLGIMGLIGVHLDPLNTTTPIMIMAIAAGHAIQILKRYYEEYKKLLASGVDPRTANSEAIVESLVRVGPVMAVAGAIASLTLFSLAGAGIPMVQHFGIFAGFGVLSAMVIELTVIPAVRSLLRPPKRHESDREQAAGVLDRLLTRMADNLVGGRAPWFVGGGLLMILVVGAGMARLRIDNNFRLYFKPDSQLRRDDKELNRLFGGTNSIQFLVETKEQDGVKDPKVLQGMERLQTFLESQPSVGKTQSLVDQIKRMNQAMHGDAPAFYSIPESRDLIAQYLFLYSTSGSPEDFDTFVDNDYRRASVWAFLKDDSTTSADKIAKAANAVIAASFPAGTSVRMGGSLAQVIALNDVIVKDKLRNMAQMALVVFLLGSLVFRSLTGGLFVVVPLFAVMATNFGLMGWLGTPLDITAMSAAAMAIGIGADYEIYLLFRFREELRRTGSVRQATRTSLLTSGKAIIFVALSVLGGYAVLQVSTFAFYNTLSNLVAATMFISAFIALFFLRALMMMFKPRFIFGDTPEKFFEKSEVLAGGGA